MRACIAALAISATLATSAARAHGPQIQITIDNSEIVTREIILDGPYSASLTAPKSLYVMPLLEFGGRWYSRPNNAPSATIPGTPSFPSGPGLAYGYDLADGGPQAFAEGSTLSLYLTGFLQWNGTTFDVPTGDLTHVKAFSGSNPDITTPPEDFTISTNTGPYDEGVSMPPVAANYGTDGAEVHSSLRYVLLNNNSPDGVYALGLGITTTQEGLTPSDHFSFVLYKNSPIADVVAAVQSLGVPPDLVQWVVPEPNAVVIAAIGLNVFVRRRGRPLGQG